VDYVGKTMGTYLTLDTDKKGSYQILDNGMNFNEVKKEHMKSHLEMLLRCYIPVKKELFREEDTEETNSKLLDEHYPSWRDETHPQNLEGFDRLCYTSSRIEYKNIVSGKKKTRIFIERTPCAYALINFVYGKTKVVKLIEKD
jgi:hypothetical protein